MLSEKKQRSYLFGLLAELAVIAKLFLTGHRIIKWRYKTFYGEIDIITRKRGRIFFCEVKYRKLDQGEVLLKKQISRIKKTGEYFLSQNTQYSDFDVTFILVKVNKFFQATKENIN